jgi:hypothetical protein
MSSVINIAAPDLRLSFDVSQIADLDCNDATITVRYATLSIKADRLDKRKADRLVIGLSGVHWTPCRARHVQAVGLWGSEHWVLDTRVLSAGPKALATYRSLLVADRRAVSPRRKN